MEGICDLQSRLMAIAKRSAEIRAGCRNEESTKTFLVQPVLSALGYDFTNPFEVQPEYAADFRAASPERADYVILRDGLPAIAVECKTVGSDLVAGRGQLRAYFTALPTVHLGILTDGIRFEFFVDCENPNIMDSEPFVTLDLGAAAGGLVPSDVLEALTRISKPLFAPQAISAMAEGLLIAKRVRTVLVEEVRSPSEEFCRNILRRAGVTHVPKALIEARYSSLVRSAIEEALVVPVVEALRSATAAGARSAPDADNATSRIITTERELAVYRYVLRRLAYLAADEQQFAAIELVKYRDYLGKFAVYYQSINKGRLFDFFEGGNGYDKFVFPEPFGEITTNSVMDIDQALRAVFERRVRELGTAPLAEMAALLRA